MPFFCRQGGRGNWGRERVILPTGVPGDKKGRLRPPQSGTLLTIGTDAIPEALVAVRDGQLDATIQYPIIQAEIALEKLVHYLETGKLPAWKEYLVKPWVITSKNISTGDFYSVIED